MFIVPYSASNDSTTGTHQTAPPGGRDVRSGNPQHPRSVQHPPFIQEHINKEHQYKASLTQQLEEYPDRGEARAQYVADWTKMFESLGSDGCDDSSKSQTRPAMP